MVSAGRQPKGVLNRCFHATLYCPTCQNSSGAPHKFQQMRRIVCKHCLTTASLRLCDWNIFTLIFLWGLPPFPWVFCTHSSPVWLFGVVHITRLCQWLRRQRNREHNNTKHLDSQSVAFKDVSSLVLVLMIDVVTYNFTVIWKLLRDKIYLCIEGQ